MFDSQTYCTLVNSSTGLSVVVFRCLSTNRFPRMHMFRQISPLCRSIPCRIGKNVLCDKTLYQTEDRNPPKLLGAVCSRPLEVLQ